MNTFDGGILHWSNKHLIFQAENSTIVFEISTGIILCRERIWKKMKVSPYYTVFRILDDSALMNSTCTGCMPGLFRLNWMERLITGSTYIAIVSKFFTVCEQNADSCRDPIMIYKSQRIKAHDGFPDRLSINAVSVICCWPLILRAPSIVLSWAGI